MFLQQAELRHCAVGLAVHKEDAVNKMCTPPVTGLEVLTAMERVPTDDDDRPTQEIRITGATVFVNPFKEMEEEEKKQEEEDRLKVRYHK